MKRETLENIVDEVERLIDAGATTMWPGPAPQAGTSTVMARGSLAARFGGTSPSAIRSFVKVPRSGVSGNISTQTQSCQAASVGVQGMGLLVFCLIHPAPIRSANQPPGVFGNAAVAGGDMPAASVTVVFTAGVALSTEASIVCSA